MGTGDVTKSDILALFRERLQAAGLKSTRQRDTIVETFFELDEHISVDELLLATRKTNPRIGYATVYRTLKLLVDLSFASPRQFGDGQTRYDPQTEAEQHDHMICNQCRKIIEFTDPSVVQVLHDIAAANGFSMSSRRLEIYGLCDDGNCQGKRPT